MGTQIKNLYEYAKDKYGVSLETAEVGMTNSVSWIYLAEDIQNTSFLKGGEFVITTGLFTKSGSSLSDFIFSLVTSNCSGLLINIGKYLTKNDITNEIQEFCMTHNFPLFTMPWEVHLIDIMQDYCRILLQNTQSTEHLNAAFQSALYQTPLHETILLTLNQYEFPTQAEYRIIVIQNLTNTTRVTFSLNYLNIKYHLFEHANKHVLIYLSSQCPASLNEIIDILLYCDSISLGISGVILSLNDISECYKRACFSLAAALFWKTPFVQFDDLGIFQILFSSSDPQMLQSIYQNSLGKLEEMDFSHDSNYLETLRIFLLSDCSLLETASRMNTHRNTIIYRIKKIKECLGTEFDNSRIKFDLLMAFYIREYFLI